MGLNRFDGTTSKLADDAVGDDRKSSKTINANTAYNESALDLSAFAGMDAEAVA